MKLKLVVASMSVLGLVSCPVFAATTIKHKHHHKHHRVERMEQVEHRDYKDMGDLPVQPAPVEVCKISQNSMIMDDMTQSIGRSMPSPCNPGWFNRVQLSGGINVDLGKFGNRNRSYMGENTQRFSLNDAYINVAASVNDWAKAFASISYNTATVNPPGGIVAVPAFPAGLAIGSILGEYSAAYSNNVASGSSSTLQLEQAYATLGNLDVSPFFIQVGKQFQDFSRYEIHPITRSLTQVLSETLATSGKIGFITEGFNGSIYAFDDPIAKIGQSSKPTNYGASLGYDMPSDQFGFDVGISYLYDMIGANDVAYMVNQWEAVNGGGYRTRAAGGAVYADINSGPFVLSGRYTQALQRFNPNDLPKNGVAAINPLTGFVNTTANGAKPWAAGVQGGYGFDGWGKNMNVYLGYQASRQAAGLNLPKDRYLAGIGVDLFGKNSSVALEWDHDKSYSVSNGGSHNNTNLVSVRTSVAFG